MWPMPCSLRRHQAAGTLCKHNLVQQSAGRRQLLARGLVKACQWPGNVLINPFEGALLLRLTSAVHSEQAAADLLDLVLKLGVLLSLLQALYKATSSKVAVKVKFPRASTLGSAKLYAHSSASCWPYSSRTARAYKQSDLPVASGCHCHSLVAAHPLKSAAPLLWAAAPDGAGRCKDAQRSRRASTEPPRAHRPVSGSLGLRSQRLPTSAAPRAAAQMVSSVATNGPAPEAPAGGRAPVDLPALTQAYASGSATPSSVLRALHPALAAEEAMFITLAPLSDLLERCRCAALPRGPIAPHANAAPRAGAQGAVQCLLGPRACQMLESGWNARRAAARLWVGCLGRRRMGRRAPRVVTPGPCSSAHEQMGMRSAERGAAGRAGSWRPCPRSGGRRCTACPLL
jgi:hypothetical protein